VILPSDMPEISGNIKVYTKMPVESGQESHVDRRRWHRIYYPNSSIKARPLISTAGSGRAFFQSDFEGAIELTPNSNGLLEDYIRQYPLQSLEIPLQGEGNLFMSLLEKLSSLLESEQVAILLDDPRCSSKMQRVFVNYFVLEGHEYKHLEDR